MTWFKKYLKHGERGFTLIELLVVVAILGILAAVAIPNVAKMMGSSTLNAANTEAANVKTAAVAYAADNNGTWPATSAALTSDYLAGTIKGVYTFGTNGLISEAAVGTWTGITWDAATQLWKKA